MARLVELEPWVVLVCFAWMQVENRDRTLDLRLNSETPSISLWENRGVHHKGGPIFGTKEFVQYQHGFCEWGWLE